MKRNTGAARDEAKYVCACECEADKGTNISGWHADTASAASWKRLDVGILPPYSSRTDADFWPFIKNPTQKIQNLAKSSQVGAYFHSMNSRYACLCRLGGDFFRKQSDVASAFVNDIFALK